MIKVNLLGATGSIGLSTLNVVQSHPDQFQIQLVTANRNLDKLMELIRQFRPAYAAMADPSCQADLRTFLRDQAPQTRYLPFEEALRMEADITVIAIVGSAGLVPTWHAIRHSNRVALANKESLVAAGELICRAAAEHGTEILPVDSEHNAIHQCLRAGKTTEVQSIILTASGGPFFGMKESALDEVTVSEALQHPTWQMGSKVTIDSATMMNKGLEVIEAHYLFQMPYERIRIKVHPQSIIHSMVEFQDGSILAQLGQTDMQLPILYALRYPERLENRALRFPMDGSFSLEFHDPDPAVFRCLNLAYRAGSGTAVNRIVLNAANETAVGAFLNGRLSFGGIPRLIEHMMEQVDAPVPQRVEDIVELDRQVNVQAEVEVSRGHF